MSVYVVTARVGPRIERVRFESVLEALDEIEARGHAIAARANARPVEPKLMRRFEPMQQVFARLELAGPQRLRAGVDVRGDGSVESYTGRVRRRVIGQRRGESAYDALRRAVASP